MRVILFIIGVVAALIAATFLPQVKEYRAEKALAHYEQGDLKAAKRLYFYGKLQGSQMATNNYHVINYHMARNNEKVKFNRYPATRRKAFRAFDKLTQEGYLPAAYNAGMFYYHSNAGSEDRQKGLAYFEYAAAAGDEMSRDAAGILRAREHKKEEKTQAFRKSADAGNGLAAYRYAKNLRFDKKKLRRAEKYAVMGAEAGYSDAQQFLGTYFPKRKDAVMWLEKAATNPQYPSLIAAHELSQLAEKDKDYAAQRRWLTLGSTPREKFRYRIINESGALRWRGLQNSIIADVNNSKSAAYDLALMQLDGIGGALDYEGAQANLEYAEKWSDARQLLARIQSGDIDRSKPMRSQISKNQSEIDLEKFDRQKNYPFHGKLRPYLVSKKIRYATQADLDKYKQGVSTMFSNEKLGFRKWGRVEQCALGRTCFYMEKSFILPKDMFGAHSATFLINPALYLPKQNLSHNKYIFLNERYVP